MDLMLQITCLQCKKTLQGFNVQAAYISVSFAMLALCGKTYAKGENENFGNWWGWIFGLSSL